VDDAWRADKDEAIAALESDAATEVADTAATDDEEMAADWDMAAATADAFWVARFSSQLLLTIGRYAQGGKTVPVGTPAGYTCMYGPLLLQKLLHAFQACAE